MARTAIVFYRETDGTIPFLDWFEGLAEKAQDKCRLRLERLRELGHELRRPEADYLRDGIHELRVGLGGINYRILYFFHGRDVVVVSHGIVKEREVPAREINLAVIRRDRFQADPGRFTLQEL